MTASLPTIFKSRYFPGGLSLLLTLAACSSNQATSPSSHIGSNTSSYLSSNQCFELKTNLLERAKANEFFVFNFHFSKACVDSKKIDKVVFLADMPAHLHGMNTTPSVKHVEGNNYQVEGTLLHMSGEWRARFEIYYDAKIEIIELDFTL